MTERLLDILRSCIQFPCDLQSCCLWYTAWNPHTDSDSTQTLFTYHSLIFVKISEAQRLQRCRTFWADVGMIMALLCSAWHDAALLGAYRLKNLKATQREQKQVWCTSCSEKPTEPPASTDVCYSRACTVSPAAPPVPIPAAELLRNTTHTRYHTKMIENDGVS